MVPKRLARDFFGSYTALSLASLFDMEDPQPFVMLTFNYQKVLMSFI